MSFSRLLLAPLTLAIGSLLTLFFLITRVPPYLWARWLFFAAIFGSAFGLSFPFYYFWQSVQNRPAATTHASRQAALTGFYLAAYLWLEQGLALSRLQALALTLPFLGLEALLGKRKRPTPSPDIKDDEHE